MNNVEWVYALIEVGQSVTRFVQQMSTPSKYCEAPEPRMETVNHAAKHSHVIVDQSIENPSAIDIWYCIMMLSYSNPDECNCPDTGNAGNHNSPTFEELVIFLLGNYASIAEEEKSEEPKPFVADTHEPRKPRFQYDFTKG